MGIIYNEKLSKHCSMRVGGIAEIYIEARNSKHLKSILKYAKINCKKYFVLGNGTNVIFKDSGFCGVIICTAKMQDIKKTKRGIVAYAGTNLYKLNTKLAEFNLEGLEWSYGIPGTIGGAVCMNAGAYGEEIGKYIEKVEVFENGKIKIIKAKNINFSYRNSSIKQKNQIVTRVWLALKKGNRDDIIKKQKFYLSQRKLSQPLEFFNSGSIFKKNQDESAGKIIDNLGLKGVKIGGAEVSQLHGNFIINKGNATATDVIELIEFLKQRVFEETGHMLEEEVIIVGE